MDLLLIEDDPIQARLFEAVLGRFGARVRHRAEVGHAVATIDDTPADDFADLVLIDVILRDGSGFEILDHLRRRPDLAAVPVVMWSGRVRHGDIIRAKQNGAAVLLPKPSGLANLRRFAAALHRHLRDGTDLVAMDPFGDTARSRPNTA